MGGPSNTIRTEQGHDPLEVLRRRRIPAEPLGYVVPLDGLRALAVIGVLLYHARFAWIPGGYLGVSAFFTLSGFLITSLLLREWNRDRSIDLRSFWGRRFRRLLPASWFTLGLVVGMGALGLWSTEQLRDVRSDVPFSLLEIVNWHFVFADRSYGDVFSEPSPLEHFWSLAIEQQFYFLLPLLVLAVLQVGRRAAPRHRVRRLAMVFAALTVLSLALNGLLASRSIDRAYFGTDTRMAELLIGALLACATLRRLRFSGFVRRLLVAAGVVGLAISFWLWHTTALRSEWVYPWGLLLTAASTSAVILGAVQEGWLSRTLSVAPLRYLGRISYGVYLLHWPIFLWLSPARVGWSQWPLFALRVTLTLAAAALMFHVLEDPVRRGIRLKGLNAVRVGAIGAVALLVADLAITRDLPAGDSLTQAAAGNATDTPTTTEPPPPLRTVVMGGTLAGSLGWALDQVEGFEPYIASTPGCGLAMGGWVALPDNTAERDVDRCRGERETWVERARELAPEVILIQGSMRDVTDRRLQRGDPWAGPGDPRIDDFLTAEIGDFVDQLGDTGAELVLVAMPHVRNTEILPPAPPPPPPEDPRQAQLVGAERAMMTSGVPPVGHRENEPSRVDRLNDILRAVAESRGIRFLDLREAMAEWPEGALDPAMRPDGVGYSVDAAEHLGDWLLPQLRERVAVAPPADTSPVLDPNAPLPEAPPPTDRRQAPAGTTPDVVIIGDSIGFNVGYGLSEWSRTQGGLRVHNSARLGCPIARGGSYRFKRDLAHFPETCEWAEYLPDRLNTFRPEVVVISSGIWEIVDRRLPGDDRFRSVGDPGVDRYLLREFLAAIDVLGSDGATVVVLTQPHIESGLNQGFTDLPESEPERTDRVNELWREAVSLRPGVATLIDLQGWLAAQPGGEISSEHRPDGVHFTDEYAPTIGAWLGPQLIDLARG